MDFDKEMQEIIQNDLKERHSLFQLKYFLIGKEPTTQARLWRCVRELKSRSETVESIQYEIEEMNDKIQLINLRLTDLINLDDSMEQVIKERRLLRRKKVAERQIEKLNYRLLAVKEECEFLIKSFRSLEQVEPLKDQDDLEAQKAYWDSKLGQEMKLRLDFGLPMDIELLKTTLALHKDSDVKNIILKIINNPTKNITKQES